MVIIACLHGDDTVAEKGYVYGTDATAANYRLCISETATERNGSLTVTRVTGYTYSSDKKGNVVSERVEYEGEESLTTETTYSYGACSLLTKRRVKISDGRYVTESYTLDTELGSLVPSKKEIYETAGNETTLRI